MSYTPTQWQTGDTITAEKLNNIESGISAINKPGTALVMRWSDVEGCWVVDRDESISVFGTLVAFEEVQEGQEPVITYLEIAEENGYRRLSFISSVDYSKQSIVHYANRIFTYTIDSNGKLVVGSSVVGDLGPYIVTLTPTAQDFSGVMDKTPAGIATAIGLGMKIIFSFPSLSASVEATQFVGGSVACANITYDIGGQDVLIQIVTSASDSTYSTKIFPLTPMS